MFIPRINIYLLRSGCNREIAQAGERVAEAGDRGSEPVALHRSAERSRHSNRSDPSLRCHRAAYHRLLRTDRTGRLALLGRPCVGMPDLIHDLARQPFLPAEAAAAL